MQTAQFIIELLKAVFLGIAPLIRIINRGATVFFTSSTNYFFSA